MKYSLIYVTSERIKFDTKNTQDSVVKSYLDSCFN